MDDDSREFFTSQLVRLELLPKARFADCVGSQPLRLEPGWNNELEAAGFEDF
jgi:hypothetical protein